MKNNKGFTLLEMMIVMLLIGILAAIVAPNYFEIRLNGMNRDAQEAANCFFMKAVDHFDDVDGNKTVYPITLNFQYYVLDANIEASGSLTDINGVISSSSLEFSHRSSATIYELSETGIITEK